MNPVVSIYNRQRKLKVTEELKNLVKCCVAESLECENKSDRLYEVDVSFVSDKKIHEYNLIYRNIDRATDVLSFPMGQNGRFELNPENGALMLGDIVISLERALEQSYDYGHSYEREVGFLTVHSMLHLLGYDHINEADGDIMRAHEKIILNKIGLTR